MFPGSFSCPRIFSRIPHPICFHISVASSWSVTVSQTLLVLDDVEGFEVRWFAECPFMLSLSDVFLMVGLGLSVWREDNGGEVSFHDIM